MNILTVENKTHNIDSVPEEIDDLRFCVLDCSDPTYIDYQFFPLVFLESFYAPAVVLDIGGSTVRMSLDWSILVCDEEMIEVEVIPLTKLNDRGFNAFIYNPLSDMTPVSVPIEIKNVYSEVKWFFPKLKNGCMLCVPLYSFSKSPCAYFVKDDNKLPKYIDIAELF